MPHGDDLDQRFNELVAQIDAEQQRKMREAAKKEARASRRARSEDAGRLRRNAERAGWDRPAWDSTVWDATPRPHEPRRRARRVWPAVAGITAVIAAAGVVITLRPDLLAPTGAVAGQTMPVAAPPASPAVAEAGPEATSEGPFAGSEAEDWAEGAAGFVMPEAKAIGGLSKKDVAEGMARIRELLAAAHLDRETLMGGEPKAFMKLLHPEERSWFGERLDREGPGDTRWWVTSFAPGTAEQVGDVIKVRGRTKLTSFELDGREGAELETDYIIVHAVRRPGQPDTTIRLLTRQRGTFLVYREAGELVVWVRKSGGYATPARCDVDGGFIHPSYDGSAPSTKNPAGDPVDPYELDGPQPRYNCQASTGT
ncbi:hypothetical protein HD597_006706 [Nonomuraea thailandensis]|uniref:Uncharacterized protein n=1 Tax=Nonomuraea thailandensis TaxID=1188745 RepID=A0A9X2GQ81_9ACTN|nr:HK97 gp10 family phage protein [Nonomuraea thailandensis]MCP2359686.1 hypothetical protein [Nonomuraea thailandensis]